MSFGRNDYRRESIPHLFSKRHYLHRMLTFFRRIRQGLLNSGATRKYLLYAIGEIALVVIGILIALQINNWNEYRNERETEEKVLKELVENLETNIQRLQFNIERGKTDNAFSEVIISVIDQETPYSDSLDKYFPLALNAVDEGLFLSFVGYESLKNTGFEIIQDDQLRNEIITLFEGTYKDLRARYDRIQWASNELGIFTDQHFYQKASTVQREFAPFDFDNLVRSKRLSSWLIKLTGYRLWISAILHESKAETQRVLQLIKDELRSADM